MNNCKVTKLNSSINNDNLPLFDAIRMEFSFPNEKIGSSIDLNLNPLVPIQASLEGATWNSNNESTLIINPYTQPDAFGSTIKLTPSSNNVTLIIGSKYNIASIRLDGGGSALGTYASKILLADLLFLSYWISIDGGNANNYVFNLDTLAGKKGIAKRFLCSFYINSTGNIASLSGFTDLEVLNIGGSSINDTHISGELTELASGMVSNGRTSGTLTFTSNKWITLNGVTLANKTVKVITFDSSLQEGYSIGDPA